MYGQKFVHAPNLEAFANRSLVFDRAYCQIAVSLRPVLQQPAGGCAGACMYTVR